MATAEPNEGYIEDDPVEATYDLPLVERDWALHDAVIERRFKTAPYIADVLLFLSLVIGVTGTVGCIVLGASNGALGVSSGAAIGLAIAGFFEVLVVSALLAAAGWGLRVLMAIWAETWASRQEEEPEGS